MLAWATAAAGAVAYLAVLLRGASGPVRLVKVVPAVALAFVVAPTGLLAAVGLGAWALGDLLLLRKNDSRSFIGGLSAFLVGHLFVVASVGRVAPGAVTVVLGVVAAGLMAGLWPGLRGVLRVAVPLYTLALISMASAVGAAHPLALAGGVVFVVSDGVLAWNHFRTRLPGAEPVVIVTYYAALGLISAGLTAGSP